MPRSDAAIPGTFAINIPQYNFKSAITRKDDKLSKMVYNWEGKKDTCYNMYITENKGLEEIQAFYREQGFNPR